MFFQTLSPNGVVLSLIFKIALTFAMTANLSVLAIKTRCFVISHLIWPLSIDGLSIAYVRGLVNRELRKILEN